MAVVLWVAISPQTSFVPNILKLAKRVGISSECTLFAIVKPYSATEIIRKFRHPY